jgi:eukaryotic-like serine/threonine-protein kinase
MSEPATDPRIGQAVLGRYQIVRRIAEGGMGTVYEARHTELGRRFAIKFVREELAADRKLLARFEQEARTAGMLESDRIGAIVDLGRSPDGAPCLVMEYLDGENLEELLRAEGPLPVARAVEIVRQICAGLSVAHARGIIHRDLKPRNLIVCRTSEGRDSIKIVDFGIAKAQQADRPGVDTTAGAALGTPHYMPPEQARGEQIDTRADVYATGVILYELLTGARPHPGSSYNAIIYHILSKQPEPVRELRPEIPERLAEIVHRAIATDLAERHQSADELRGALEPYAPGALAPLDSNLDTLAARAVSSQTVGGGRKSSARVAITSCVTTAVVLMLVGYAGFRIADPSTLEPERMPSAVASRVAPPVIEAPPAASVAARAPPAAPSPAPAASSASAPASVARASERPSKRLPVLRPAPSSPHAAPFDWQNPY